MFDDLSQFTSMTSTLAIPLQPVGPTNGSALSASQQTPTPIPAVPPCAQLPQDGAAPNAFAKSSWDRVGGIYGAVISVLATALTIVTFVPPFRLAKWTSRKDYIELCLTLNVCFFIRLHATRSLSYSKRAARCQMAATQP